MKRLSLAGGSLLIVLLATLLIAAGQEPERKPLLRIGQSYVFLSPGEAKRTAEVVEDLGGGWYKMKYLHSDGVERMIWMNLNQIVYFQPAEGDVRRGEALDRRDAIGLE